MSFLELVKQRRSVRAYSDEPVTDEQLQQILEAARLAPSARNSQNWKFVVIRDADLRRQMISLAGNQAFVGQAPVLVVAVGLDPERIMSCQVPAYAVDLAIAVDHMTLMAAELGLGTCWIGRFDQDGVRNLLGIPSDNKIVALLPLGHPADEPRPKARRSLAEIVCSERFS